MTETYVVRFTNFMAYAALLGHTQRNDNPSDDDILVDFTDEVTMLADQDSLLTHLNLILMGGSMTAEFKNILKENMNANSGLEPADQIANLVFLIMSSPQYSVQL